MSPLSSSLFHLFPCIACSDTVLAVDLVLHDGLERQPRHSTSSQSSPNTDLGNRSIPCRVRARIESHSTCHEPTPEACRAPSASLDSRQRRTCLGGGVLRLGRCGKSHGIHANAGLWLGGPRALSLARALMTSNLTARDSPLFLSP